MAAKECLKPVRPLAGSVPLWRPGRGRYRFAGREQFQALCANEGAIIIYLWVTIYTVVLIWSGINPKDLPTWLLEVSPALAGALVLVLTYKSFRLTPLVYSLILIHCIILMIGGHYTYAEVPLFDYMKDM